MTADQIIANAGDEVLWEISSDRPPERLIALYGTLPTGFDEVVPASPLTDGQVALEASWADAEIQHAVLFEFDDLPSSGVLSDSGAVDESEFVASAS
jgi:hypothetical protein